MNVKVKASVFYFLTNVTELKFDDLSNKSLSSSKNIVLFCGCHRTTVGAKQKLPSNIDQPHESIGETKTDLWPTVTPQNGKRFFKCLLFCVISE